MLDELVIRNVGVIAGVELSLKPGLTVVTGETGAGKTMVVWALELLLGARAEPGRVRSGADRAVVEARIAPAPETAREWQDGAQEDLVVSRDVVVTGDGVRSRVRLGGRLAPVSALATVLGGHVEVHGQSDTHRLSDAGVQRGLLDRFGGPALRAVRDPYDAVHAAWHDAAARLHDLETGSRERARETDRLTAELDEIGAVAPQPGEDTAIDADLRRLEHAEGLLAAAHVASQALVADGGARDGLGAAVAALRPVGGIDAHLQTLLHRVEAAAAEAQDLALELEQYADQLDIDPARADDLRARRMALRALTRKYGADVEAVLAYADGARRRLDEMAAGDAGREQRAPRVGAVGHDRDGAARRLREARREAGRRLTAVVDGHLADLGMAGAAFAVEVEPVPPGPTGADRVRFALRANPGEPTLPIAEAASGGERSRIALALRLALAEADDTAVLVFDEVDAGVGGRVALAVGEKLARLATGRQVLCVTHQAQLAAYADHHVVVTKGTVGGRTEAAVTVLDESARLEELSRLLSGGTGSLATDHAAQLRESARRRLGRTGVVR